MHGAVHAGPCWAPLLPQLDRPALTVDLPGRETNPAALDAVGLDDAVGGVMDTIRRRVPATYVILGRDWTLPVRQQRRHLARLGPCEVATMDAGHEGFVARPAEIAETLNRVARLTLEVA